MSRRYAVERRIDATPETVWNLLTDADGYASWNDAVLSIAGPIEVGETIELVSVVNPKRTFRLTVAEMAAPSRMVWTDGMPFGLFTGTRTYTLASVGEATTFAMVEEFTGPLAGLITKMIPDLTESFEQFADGLKAAAEA